MEYVLLHLYEHNCCNRSKDILDLTQISCLHSCCPQRMCSLICQTKSKLALGRGIQDQISTGNQRRHGRQISREPKDRLTIEQEKKMN